jgi:hypothetical protein
MEYFATVCLDRIDGAAESAGQVMRATIAVLEEAGGVWAEDGDVRKLFISEASTDSDLPGMVISTAELSDDDATTLWHAYPYQEDVLDEWENRGWKAVDSA